MKLKDHAATIRAHLGEIVDEAERLTNTNIALRKDLRDTSVRCTDIANELCEMTKERDELCAAVADGLKYSSVFGQFKTICLPILNALDFVMEEDFCGISDCVRVDREKPCGVALYWRVQVRVSSNDTWFRARLQLIEYQLNHAITWACEAKRWTDGTSISHLLVNWLFNNGLAKYK